MKTYLECIPCFFRQALKTSRIATDDEAMQEYILRQVAKLVGRLDFSSSPPYLAAEIYRLIGKLTGCEDPYFEIKRESNRLASDFYPKMKRLVVRSRDPMETAIRLAIAGNVIDFGVRADAGKEVIASSIKDSLRHHIPADIMGRLKSKISAADNILYIGDNAGEIVFDKFLIEHMLPKKVTYAVRSGAIINDATMLDAVEVGLSNIVEVIESGSSVPGTVLEKCSPEFIRYYDSADLIIAKGQGNYETLDDEKKGIFFLLKIKCHIVERDTKNSEGSFVIIEK